MEQPKVSIVIPFYNSERFAGEVIDAVTQQTLKETEIILVDDGSGDGTLALLEGAAKDDPRISVIREDHTGAGTARNLGLHEATGKYIMFLDSDDTFQPSFVEEMYDAAEAHDADITMCSFLTENFKTGQVVRIKGFDPVWLKPGTSVDPGTLKRPFLTVSPYPHNKMWRREWILDQGIGFSATHAYNDHFFSYASLVKAKRITAIEKELYTYRIYYNSDSISSHRAEFAADFLKVDKEIYEWLEREGLINKYMEDYLRLWRGTFRGAAGNCVSETFQDLVVKTLMEEDPWKTMPDKDLQREAGLQVIVAELRLKRLKMNANKENGRPPQADALMISQAEHEIENIRAIIKKLRLHGRKIDEHVGTARVGMWLLRDRGVHGMIETLGRAVHKRFL